MIELKLSTLPKTWIIDLDGVIFKHNEYKILQTNEVERPLPGVIKFFEKIPANDYIIILSARKGKFRKRTIKALRNAKIRFDLLLMDLPIGERILINDEKPNGLKTAHSINLKRDAGLQMLNYKQTAML